MTAQAMTVKEFGRRIGVSRSSAYDIVARGQVELTDVGAGTKVRLRITEQALESYLERRRIPARRAS